jgi:hypothetical protein
LSRRADLEKLEVTGESEELRQALNYPHLTGLVTEGDRVILNTTATDLNLGTGGWDFVMANLSRADADSRRTFGEPTTGHLMKLRYTPHQIALPAAEENDPELPTSLEGRPVVIAELHSQIAPILIGVRLAMEAEQQPLPRMVYVVPDTAALPLALSETVPLLKERVLIHSSVTCGHAFGGDHEAVHLASGLCVAAGSAQGDLMIVAQGPGNAGTASPYGFGGIYQSEAVHLTAALGGDPILVMRFSDADPRTRHRGLSHHTRTLLEKLLLTPVTLACFDDTAQKDPATHSPLNSSYERMALAPRQRNRIIYAPSAHLLDGLRNTDLPLRSMGRGLNEDPAFFLAAAAAGWVAGKLHLERAQSSCSPETTE